MRSCSRLVAHVAGTRTSDILECVRIPSLHSFVPDPELASFFSASDPSVPPTTLQRDTTVFLKLRMPELYIEHQRSCTHRTLDLHHIKDKKFNEDAPSPHGLHIHGTAAGAGPKSTSTTERKRCFSPAKVRKVAEYKRHSLEVHYTSTRQLRTVRITPLRSVSPNKCANCCTHHPPKRHNCFVSRRASQVKYAPNS